MLSLFNGAHHFRIPKEMFPNSIGKENLDYEAKVDINILTRERITYLSSPEFT